MSSRSHQDSSPSIQEIRDRLSTVTDPELDESIVELDYVDDIDVQGVSVGVTFSLPTAWCSPAFAWMMATDARDAVESLATVEQCTVTLRKHMHETEITEGVNARQTFDSVFPDADGDVASVRSVLDNKARLARQYAAINELLDAGLTGEQIVKLTQRELTLGDEAVVFVQNGSIGIPIEAEPLASYLQKARETGHVNDHEPLFRTPEGDPIDTSEFDIVHKRSRLANVNMTGQGNVCDALNRARFASDRPPARQE